MTTPQERAIAERAITHQIPLPDWRDGRRGIPIAAIRDTNIIHVADIAPLMRSRFDLEEEGDADAMDSIEGISDRPGPNRWSDT